MPLPLLQHLDTFLQQHGTTAGGDYLLGGQFSLAEVGTTSFVQRALAALPHYRSVDTWALLKEQGLARWAGELGGVSSTAGRRWQQVPCPSCVFGLM